MNSLSFKKILLVTVAASALAACGKGNGQRNIFEVTGGTPVTENKGSLRGMRFQSQGTSFTYYRGYNMQMVNSLVKGKPTIGEEPLAYVESCPQKAAPAPGELRFEQSSYKANGQNGKNVNLKCELMPVSEELLTDLLDAFPTCMDRSLKAVSLEKPRSVVLHSVMIYQHKGRGNRLSLHAPARAIDMSKLELVYADRSQELVVAQAGKKNNPVNKETTMERKFFETFRACWDEHLVQKHGCNSAKKGSYRGSVGWEDGDHQKHIHISRPFCPSNSNYLAG